MNRKHTKGWLKHGDFIIIDIILLQLCYVISYFLIHGISNPYASESFQELEKFVNGIIQKEKALLESHRRQQWQEWESCNDHLKSIIRDNKGVWLSNKVFWWAIGIFELVACLAIYFGGNALIAAIR